MKRFYITSSILVSLFSNLSAQSQYASSVIAFSSEYPTAPAYGSVQILGAPDVSAYGDNANAWTNADADNQREFIVVGFTTPLPVSVIKIYETYTPGAIDTVYLRDASTGIWNTVYTATAAATPPILTILTINIATTPYNVDALRIATNSPVVLGWNEIDAVEILPCNSN